ncbi:ankyrin repeat domain-containing protein SOWAHC [Fundulus heteroclitus]|uniref:ankyrin repeat domain-containing protein SOWAHC n=1 Tax=Fundulus heteroclitus TaxID=8078 RepID=UPI00165B8EF4|nr:ankyrin repeat domain-containing protein SOWAHC [Fundulus heteroclitus]
MYESGSASFGSEPADAHGSGPPRQSSVVERLSRYGMPVMPGASQRRWRLQRQQEVSDGAAPGGLSRDPPERESIPPALRRKYLKLLLSGSASSGWSSVLQCSRSQSLLPEEEVAEEEADWALYPMEHAWMLLAVEGSYETILDFISEDPQLLTRRDFISGYSVLHWLAKRGQDEVLLKLLRYAERADVAVNVNLRGSGGLTPLHVASMHGRFAVIKLLVGAFGADVDAMDYNGRRPWQYLKEDAPLEMKELLGTWDEQHSCGVAQLLNKNVNNNCAGAVELAACDEVDGAEPEEVNTYKTKKSGWRFSSLRKLISSSFVGYKT